MRPEWTQSDDLPINVGIDPLLHVPANKAGKVLKERKGHEQTIRTETHPNEASYVVHASPTIGEDPKGICK